jgi:DUF971 family protein
MKDNKIQNLENYVDDKPENVDHIEFTTKYLKTLVDQMIKKDYDTLQDKDLYPYNYLKKLHIKNQKCSQDYLFTTYKKIMKDNKIQNLKNYVDDKPENVDHIEFTTKYLKTLVDQMIKKDYDTLQDKDLYPYNYLKKLHIKNQKCSQDYLFTTYKKIMKDNKIMKQLQNIKQKYDTLNNNYESLYTEMETLRITKKEFVVEKYKFSKIKSISYAIKINDKKHSYTDVKTSSVLKATSLIFGALNDVPRVALRRTSVIGL